MQLIGMLDSPYVRRVAICLKLLEIEFEHQAISVFSGFDRFKAINPVVKAPTLVLADGQILMDSSLILEYAAGIAPSGRALLPNQGAARLNALQLNGLALVACEKTVQIVYEQQLRPQEKQHQPWLDRVQGQLQAAYAELGLAAKLDDEAALIEAMSQHPTLINRPIVRTAKGTALCRPPETVLSLIG